MQANEAAADIATPSDRWPGSTKRRVGEFFIFPLHAQRVAACVKHALDANSNFQSPRKTFNTMSIARGY